MTFLCSEYKISYFNLLPKIRHGVAKHEYNKVRMPKVLSCDTFFVQLINCDFN